MIRPITLSLTLALVAVSLIPATGESAQANPSMQAFWTKFKTAVIKGDKATVASMTQFPIGMPYGVPPVKNRTQLNQRYREVFNGEANAAKCFTNAFTKTGDKPNSFTVGCKNAAGDEVAIYTFVLTRTGWRFKSLDNLNE